MAEAATCDLQRQMRGKHGQLGLSVAAVRLLGAPLDKTEQCSTWGQRPLRTAQLEYAALDAAVLIDLARALFATV